MLDVKNIFAVLCVSLLALQPLINLKFFTLIYIYSRTMASKSKKRSKLEEKDCLWPHGPSAIPDCFTGAVAPFCTFRARPPARAIPPPSCSSAPPVRDRPGRRTTTRPPLFLRTTHETALFIYSRKDRELKKWCSLLSAFNPFVPSVPKTMTPSKSW